MSNKHSCSFCSPFAALGGSFDIYMWLKSKSNGYNSLGKKVICRCDRNEELLEIQSCEKNKKKPHKGRESKFPATWGIHFFKKCRLFFNHKCSFFLGENSTCVHAFLQSNLIVSWTYLSFKKIGQGEVFCFFAACSFETKSTLCTRCSQSRWKYFLLCMRCKVLQSTLFNKLYWLKVKPWHLYVYLMNLTLKNIQNNSTA